MKMSLVVKELVTQEKGPQQERESLRFDYEGGDVGTPIRILQLLRDEGLLRSVRVSVQ